MIWVLGSSRLIRETGFDCPRPVVIWRKLTMLYPASFGDNPLYPKDTDFRVIRKDDTNGFGVISLRSFKRGEIVAAMAGERVSDIRQHTLQIDDNTHLHDTYFSGYFLHSCSPNISLDMRNMLITAVKDIAANSYLTMDYAETEQVLFRQFACACGSENCRGWITGNKEIHPGFIQEAIACGPDAA